MFLSEGRRSSRRAADRWAYRLTSLQVREKGLRSSLLPRSLPFSPCSRLGLASVFPTRPLLKIALRCWGK